MRTSGIFGGIAAVEAAARKRMHVKNLRVAASRFGPRLDYNNYRNPRKGVVYGKYPIRGHEHHNTIIGWHPMIGLDFSTERSEAAYESLPKIFKN